jgi:hypothetical protein
VRLRALPPRAYDAIVSWAALGAVNAAYSEKSLSAIRREGAKTKSHAGDCHVQATERGFVAN